MPVLQSREDFDRYQAAFHAGDYETAFEYYVEEPRLSIFGHQITTRSQLRQLYRFLQEHIHETVQVERFAMSDNLIAVEALIRVKGLRDLNAQGLRERGLYQFHPIGLGETQLMRNFVHYRLRAGKIESGTCVQAPP
jgi:hypothetical protein